MRRGSYLTLAAVLVLPYTVWAQGDPLGPEFRVNTYTTDNQALPSVAAGSSGRLVVVWADGAQDGSNFGVFGQRYASSGTPVGPEFRVNTYTTNLQNHPSVAAAPTTGNFVVVWESAQDGSGFGVFGQRYDSAGTTLGPEFRVNTFTTLNQYYPAVAADISTGSFVVVWESLAQDGSNFGVVGQRYASAGTPVGPEFPINTYTTSLQNRPSVAVAATGNFVVVWESDAQDGSGLGVFGQRYGSAGTTLGPEFRVNTFTTSNQYNPAVAADTTTGSFVVVWRSLGQDGSASGVFGQRYDGAGTPVGPEFRVNSHTTGNQYRPSVAVAATTGDFVVVWESGAQDGSADGIFGQRYAGSGAPVGPEFRVNTYTTDIQSRPSVAVDSSGKFVVVWQSDTQDGSAFGVFGQRYTMIVPVELMHFRVE